MPWTDELDCGFSYADLDDLWLSIPEEHRYRSVEKQIGESSSVLSLYRRFLDARNASLALEVGEYSPITTGPEDVFLFQRRHEEESLLVALSFSDRDQRFLLPSGVRDVPIRLSTEGNRKGEQVDLHLEMVPHEGVIVDYPATL